VSTTIRDYLVKQRRDAGGSTMHNHSFMPTLAADTTMHMPAPHLPRDPRDWLPEPPHEVEASRRGTPYDPQRQGSHRQESEYDKHDD